MAVTKVLSATWQRWRVHFMRDTTNFWDTASGPLWLSKLVHRHNRPENIRMMTCHKA